MNRKINRIVINSSNIPKSIQGIKQSTLCFYNINLLQKYALNNNKIKESFYFSKKYSKFSEYLLPKFNKNHSNTNMLKKEKCLLLKEDSIKNGDKPTPKKSIFLRKNNQSLKSESTSFTTMSPFNKGNIESSYRSSNDISSFRLNTPQMDKNKIIMLTPSEKGIVRTDYIRLKYLFRNEAIKNVIKNSVTNRDSQFNSASIIE